MESHQANLGIFMDDFGLGSSDAFATDIEGDPEHDLFVHHLEVLEMVLRRAMAYKLRFALHKSWIGQVCVEALGMTVGRGWLEASEVRIQGILDWPRPATPADLESYLALSVFIKRHLPPTFSDVTRPLRQEVAKLQQARLQGKKGTRKKAKGWKPTSDVDGSSPWASWWTAELDEAFLKSKRMIAHAIRLSVPDWVGAADGTNPFILDGDACGYSIGGGVFQRARETVVLGGLEGTA